LNQTIRMKTTRESGRKEWLSRSGSGVLATSLVLPLMASLLLGGCGKSGGSAPPPPAASGTTLDIEKLQQAFPSATPEIQDDIRKVKFACRYTQWKNAEEALDKLAAEPSLTDPQKQVVNDLIEEAKKLEAAAPAPAAPAQ